MGSKLETRNRLAESPKDRGVGGEPTPRFQKKVKVHVPLRQTHTKSAGSSSIGAGDRSPARSSADRAAASLGCSRGAARRDRSAATITLGCPPGESCGRDGGGLRAPAESNRCCAATVEPGIEQGSRGCVRRSRAVQG